MSEVVGVNLSHPPQRKADELCTRKLSQFVTSPSLGSLFIASLGSQTDQLLLVASRHHPPPVRPAEDESRGPHDDADAEDVAAGFVLWRRNYAENF